MCNDLLTVRTLEGVNNSHLQKSDLYTTLFEHKGDHTLLLLKFRPISLLKLVPSERKFLISKANWPLAKYLNLNIVITLTLEVKIKSFFYLESFCLCVGYT